MLLLPLSLIAFSVISFNTINGIQEEVELSQLEPSGEAVVQMVAGQRPEHPLLALNPDR